MEMTNKGLVVILYPKVGKIEVFDIPDLAMLPPFDSIKYESGKVRFNDDVIMCVEDNAWVTLN